MKDREIFSALRTTYPCFIRLDARSFRSQARALSLRRPFDERLSYAMEEVSGHLLLQSGLSPRCAYTFSDEISLYFGDKLPFDGRVEKLNSIAASSAASALTIALSLKDPQSFDARIIPVDRDLAIEYLIWRQKEAWRNHTNAYCQWAMEEEGRSPAEAQQLLHQMNTKSMHDLMFARGINLAKTPGWQRRGVMVYRRRGEAEQGPLFIDRCPPIFTTREGREFLSALLV